jgi:hypothetical protein
MAKDWNDKFDIGEMYYHPLAIELIRVLEMGEKNNRPMIKIETLWTTDEKFRTKKRILYTESNYCNSMLAYPHFRLPIMKRIFEHEV